jgi:hypothetical protein
MGKHVSAWNAMLLDEARRLVDLAEKRDFALRVMGGAAIAIHSAAGPEVFTANGRRLQDLDFVSDASGRRRLSELMTSAGYEPDEVFNSYSGHDRHLYYTGREGERWQVDVFFERMKMCHTVAYKNRLVEDHPTVPLAELLLQKLQIVQLNAKDVFDIVLLLADHPLGDHDAETINLRVITRLLASDWGYYKTATDALQLTLRRLETEPGYPASAVVRDRIAQLLESIESVAKTRKWHMRARIGTRVRWYEEVEEVVR